MARLSSALRASAALAALVAPGMACAQSIDYGNASSNVERAGGRAMGEATGGRFGNIVPYIEAAQVVTGVIAPEDDVLTYSRVAVGVDATATGRRSGASVSLRYERRIAWDDKTDDGDSMSGVVRGYANLSPAVRIDVGGLATRSRYDADGGLTPDGPGREDPVVQIYSAFVGPSLKTDAGMVDVEAGYRLGYTKVDRENAIPVGPDDGYADIFDESVAHEANLTASIAPGKVLPVGVGVAGNYYREDISDLDQRVEDMQARGIVTVPVSPTLAVTGSVGYERVRISNRDALRDAEGDPVYGSDGRYVTDKSSPRILGYDVDGLTWDVGAVWKPSRRTLLAANVGRRYGTTSVYGGLRYAPSERSTLSVLVYDNVAGFGGQVSRSLGNLPTEFNAVRNPLTGDISGCVSSLEDNGCLTGALGSIRSASFRARGISANYNHQLGRFETGIGAGYDRRKFVGAPGTVLEIYDGLTDQTYWMAAYLNGRLDRQSGFSTNLYANWFESGLNPGGDSSALGATAAYYRVLFGGLSATAAVGVDGLSRDDFDEDIWTASALVGVRYSF